MAKGQSKALIMASLGDHKPKSAREVVEASKLSEKAVYNAFVSVLEGRLGFAH